MSKALFIRVCMGLKSSDFAKKWVKDYYDKALRDEAKRAKGSRLYGPKANGKTETKA